jgi:hypothetical protein
MALARMCPLERNQKIASIALPSFLSLTLVILTVALLGLINSQQVSQQVWVPWALRSASVLLALATMCMVIIAARIGVVKHGDVPPPP